MCLDSSKLMKTETLETVTLERNLWNEIELKLIDSNDPTFVKIAMLLHLERKHEKKK